jgi:hypothetical protein
MKMNGEMSVLMERLAVHWPLKTDAVATNIPELELFEDCVLLRNDFERNRHVKISDLLDKTGFECFINHIHLPFRSTTESLVSCLAHAVSIEKALIPLAQNRRFRVIVGISVDDSSSERNCTIRFHQIRSGEGWVADNLEGYESDAVLVFDVPDSR